MTNILVPLGLTILVFGLFGLVLHWVKYKKEKGGCCGGGHHNGENTQSCCGSHTKSDDHQCACDHN